MWHSGSDMVLFYQGCEFNLHPGQTFFLAYKKLFFLQIHFVIMKYIIKMFIKQ